MIVIINAEYHYIKVHSMHAHFEWINGETRIKGNKKLKNKAKEPSVISNGTQFN